MSDGGSFRTTPTAAAVVQRRGLPLGSRIAAIVAAVLTFAFGSAIGIAYPFVKATAQQQARAALSEQTDAVARFLESAVNTDGSVIAEVPDQIAAILAQGDVTTMLFPFSAGIPAPVQLSDLQSVSGRGRHPVSDIRTAADGTRVFFELRTLKTHYVLVLMQPTEVADGPTHALLIRMGYGALVSLIVALTAVVLYTRRATAPIRHAVEAAEQMAAGARDVRLVEGGVAEFADLAHSMNALSDALAASEDRQRQFLLSVSHELRTPLTALNGYAEAMADGLVDAEDLTRIGTVMTDEAGRLRRLVEDLLDLSRAGAVELRLDPQPLDLPTLVHGAGVVWADRCEREGVEFRLEVADERLEIVSDATRLRQIIDNLLENALRVTPAGAQLVLALRSTPEGAVVEVRDSGPGLSDEDLGVAFEPSELHNRYRGIRPVGTGIGLALVGRLAARLGGRATAGHAPEGGAMFRVTVPRAWQDTGSV